MRGSQVAQRWRAVEVAESRSGGPPLLIVGCSGSTTAAEARASVHSEQDAVWTKPLPAPEQMRAVLAALLAARSSSLASRWGGGLWGA